MLYKKYEIPCPCESGKNVLQCHGAEDKEERLEERIIYSLKTIDNLNNDDKYQFLFSEQAYRSRRNDFDMFLSSIQKMGAMGIKAGADWHKGAVLTLDEGDNSRPLALFPEALIYVGRDIDLSDDSERFVLGQGLYKVAPRQWQPINRVDVEANIRFRPGENAQILINNEAVESYDFNQELIWEGLKRGIMAVRSFLVLDYEFYRHTSS
jgi:hypothetical protein